MRSLTLVRKNLTRRKVRTALTILAIAVAFLIFGMLGALRLASESGAQTGPSDRLIVSNKIGFTQPIPIGYLPQVASVPGVARVTHRTWFGGFYRQPQNFLVTYAVDPETFFTVYTDSGVAPEALQRFRGSRDGLLLGSALAKKFGVKVGDRMALFSNMYTRRSGGRSWDFQVVGLLPSAESQFQNTAIMHYSYLDEARAFGNGTVSQYIVAPASAEATDAVIAGVDRRFANSLAETATMTETAFNRAFLAQFANVSLIVLLVTGAAFASILMIVGSTMAAAVRERRHEIAVLFALGFGRRQVAGQVATESLLLSAIGGLIGMGLAAAILASVRAASQGQMDHIVLAPQIWLGALAAIIAFGLLTAAVPMGLIARMDLATALRRS